MSEVNFTNLVEELKSVLDALLQGALTKEEAVIRILRVTVPDALGPLVAEATPDQPVGTLVGGAEEELFCVRCGAPMSRRQGRPFCTVCGYKDCCG